MPMTPYKVYGKVWYFPFGKNNFEFIVFKYPATSQTGVMRLMPLPCKTKLIILKRLLEDMQVSKEVFMV